MRYLVITPLWFFITVTTFFHQTFHVVAFGQDNPKDLNDQTSIPTIETENLANSVGFTKIPYNHLNENLALNPGDIPAFPFLPSLSGSENMDYGPNKVEDIIREIWSHPFDTQNQGKPECKKRKLPWRGGGPFQTFAFCCLKGPPQPTGPRAQQENPRLPYRRRKCYIWEPTERCTPDTIDCCYCTDDRRNGFECERYYATDGALAPVSPKRDLNSIWSMPQDDALNEPTVPFLPPAETDEDYRLAMDLGGGGGGPDETPKRRGRVHRRKEWTCEPEFQVNQGVTPHNVKIDPLNEWDLPWQDYDPSDENDGDDYSDLQLPPGWPHE